MRIRAKIRTGITRQWEHIREWAACEYIPYKNDPDSDVIVCGGEHRRPLIVAISNVEDPLVSTSIQVVLIATLCLHCCRVRFALIRP
jgi:hypothetical protein